HRVLEYVDSPPAAMAAIAAALRPGGAVSVLTASAVAAVIHRALAGRFDEARRLLTGIGPGSDGNGAAPGRREPAGTGMAAGGRGPASSRPPRVTPARGPTPVAPARLPPGAGPGGPVVGPPVPPHPPHPPPPS